MNVRPLKHLAAVLFAGLFLFACGQGDSLVQPGPGDTDATSATTTEAPDGADDSDGDELVTDGDGTVPPAVEDDATNSDDGAQPDPDPVETFVVDEDSENAAAFTELAVSGLVLSLDEQACADEAAGTALAAGTGELEAVIGAVQDCASPRAIDNFSSELIVAGGATLPPTEAACVSSRLQSGDEFVPFWAALLEEEPFDFLLADLEVQNRYLDLFAECVSVGRAVSEQAGTSLSAPTIACIDDLYQDREFVRITIEADLSGNAEDQDRINLQLQSCLSNDERSALGFE